jgi:hypothetical protein
MKKIISLQLLTLIIILALVPGVFGAISSTSSTTTTAKAGIPGMNVKITFLSQDPDPVQPGEFVDLRWKVENYGSRPIYDMRVNLVLDYPFSLEDATAHTKNIGTLAARQIGKDGAIVHWKVRVDEDAVQGDNEIKLRYQIGDKVFVEHEEYDVRVKSRDLSLGVESIHFIPSQPKAGDIVTVNLNIRNYAQTFIDDVKVNLGLSETSFSPVSSTNEKVIRKISARGNATAQFLLAVSADAASQVHQIPVTLSFTDKFGGEHDLVSQFGIPIENPSEYLLNIEDTTLYTSKSKGTVTVSFSNIGKSNINFVTLELLPSEDYTILSAPTFYLGNLESDDYETAEFDVFAGRVKKQLPLRVQLTFKDSFNKEYQEETIIPLTIYSSYQAKKYGFIPAKSGRGFFFVALLAILLYVEKRRGWKDWKKLKKKFVK